MSYAHIVVIRSPCQENYPADAHPSVHKSVLESANPAWTRSVHRDAPGQRHRQQPVSGTANPGVVKQDKSSRGSMDTTKTRLGPQRVRMSGGERPIGATKRQTIRYRGLAKPPTPCSALHRVQGLVGVQCGCSMTSPHLATQSIRKSAQRAFRAALRISAVRRQCR